MTAAFPSGELPTGRVLLIHPPYVHYATGSDWNDIEFQPDPSPFLPLGLLFAGQRLEHFGRCEIEYLDCQIEDPRQRDLSGYDCYGVNVMGTQNIAAAERLVRYLVSTCSPSRVYVGGQGAEGLTAVEFERVFPGTHQVQRGALMGDGYWDTQLDRQLEKLPAHYESTYWSHEMTLLLSQGCRFGCSFCGAQTRQAENFFDTKNHLRSIASRANKLGIHALRLYCTSLDFFQQALPGGNLARLIRILEDIIEVRELFGLEIELRALTRADSYNCAMACDEVRGLVRAAGFSTFGFGADGAASPELLRAIHKGSTGLRSDLLVAFEDAERQGIVPEILYVFGVPEDTEASLAATRDLCTGLLTTFPTSTYRGFPAKNAIPGNRNWGRTKWQESLERELLLAHPSLFASLGFEALAGPISHADRSIRRLVNRFAVEMSHTAHELGRVQSYLTVPEVHGTTVVSGEDLLENESFDLFREISRRYAPQLTPQLSLSNLLDARSELNRLIPKDK